MWRGLSACLKAWVPLSWLPPCWSLRQVSQSPESLYGLFLDCYALWVSWMWSPLTLKARCLGIYLRCIFHELGCLVCSTGRSPGFWAPSWLWTLHPWWSLWWDCVSASLTCFAFLFFNLLGQLQYAGNDFLQYYSLSQWFPCNLIVFFLSLILQ